MCIISISTSFNCIFNIHRLYKDEVEGNASNNNFKNMKKVVFLAYFISHYTIWLTR
jgi:hypothetical protein